ncbi:anhydro-N-acetylmuramic acid kinase [Bacterioplanes sanyensis]|uniref:Anhydro-N-acetylmuramic acid kinase n=1 Tax=Bacterioplanes sanyensis TaxID=1249553 RepID=A0A222FHV6_9GAMM|nr:anhydro-N-acetylmuramic acid kinase [Bacterioplanes sanyensis]ASP38232.1 anhydro-N-acetylmuramic acid kinase [Bacterioplanes sanyensis]
MTLYIGLMSGTSADGLDAALVEFGPTPRLRASYALKYPAELQRQLRQLATSDTVAVASLLDVQHTLAELSVTAVQQLLHSADLPASAVRAIGSHGHTLHHRPQPNCASWQLDNPSWLAEHTGITCVADFRRRDIAAGGQGAPLVPAFHRQMLANERGMVLNIGGIANLSMLNHDDVSGFDCGPGNALLDEYCQQQHLGACDQNGQRASQGKVNQALLEQWLQDPYFTTPPPRSTGREHFNLQRFAVPVGMHHNDALATLQQLTVNSIRMAVQHYGLSSAPIWVCGGGAHNQAMMAALQQALPHHAVASTADIGIDPDWVEAMAFAWLAKQALEGQCGNIASVTGAAGGRILGGIYPA